MTQLNLQKSDKNNLRIISKPHAYFKTMTKTPVKFRKNWYKTVGGVSKRISYDIPHQMKTLNMVIPILMHFCCFLSN